MVGGEVKAREAERRAETVLGHQRRAQQRGPAARPQAPPSASAGRHGDDGDDEVVHDHTNSTIDISQSARGLQHL
jgi:hypothetical protein